MQNDDDGGGDDDTKQEALEPLSSMNKYIYYSSPGLPHLRVCVCGGGCTLYAGIYTHVSICGGIFETGSITGSDCLG